MTDFSELLWTDSKPKPKVSDTMGSRLANTPPQQNSRPYDSFSALASALRPTYQIPNSNGSQPSIHNRVSTPSRIPASTNAASNNQDAFGSLLSLGNTSRANLSIAERQAKADQDRREEELKKAKELQAQSAFWDRYDSDSKTLSTNGPTIPTGPSLSPKLLSSSILTPVSRPASGATASPLPRPSSDCLARDAWADFDVLTNSAADVAVKSPIPERLVHNATGNDANLFDFGSFDEPIVTRAESRSPHPPLRSGTPGDFDFGDREYGDALLDKADGRSEFDDDILGDLAKPVELVPRGPSPSIVCALQVGSHAVYWLNMLLRPPESIYVFIQWTYQTAYQC